MQPTPLPFSRILEQGPFFFDASGFAEFFFFTNFLLYSFWNDEILSEFLPLSPLSPSLSKRFCQSLADDVMRGFPDTEFIGALRPDDVLCGSGKCSCLFRFSALR